MFQKSTQSVMSRLFREIDKLGCRLCLYVVIYERKSLEIVGEAEGIEK